MEWHLRKAEKSEFGIINELFMEMLRAIWHTGDVTGYSEGDLDRFFDGRDEWVCVAEDETGVFAFLSIEVHHDAPAHLYLDDFSVSEKYRGRGIGTAMLQRAEDYAREIGIPLITLNVEKSNTAAYRLYERLGYRVMADEGNRWYMGKTLRGE